MLFRSKHMLFLPLVSEEETREFILAADQQWRSETPSYYEFAILFNEKQVGGVSLYLDDKRSEGELGWIIHKDYWGRGYAKEAAEGVISYAIRMLGIHHFIAHCDSENKNSYRVMEKIGMELREQTPNRRNRFSAEDRLELTYHLFRAL